MPFKSSYEVDGDWVKIKCRDPVLDQRFFKQFIPVRDSYALTVHISTGGMKREVTLDFSGVTFSTEDDYDLDDPSTLLISMGKTRAINLVSQTKTGFKRLILEHNMSYNLTGFNGEGIRHFLTDVPKTGLVVDGANFPSPLEFDFLEMAMDFLPNNIHLRGLNLTWLGMEPEIGSIYLEECSLRIQR